MTRTIVLSDLHGDASLLSRALEHAEFTSSDRLVIAGDLIDIGSDDTLGAAEAAGATILAGNHEVAAALGLLISPQDPLSLERGPWFFERFVDGDWPLALEVEGWLITHAGVSLALDDIIEQVGGEPARVAELLNAVFRSEMAHAETDPPRTWTDLQRLRIVGGQMGPLWFRPLNPQHVPSGLRQIVGHTPPDLVGEARLEQLHALGWRLVEPGGHHRRGGFRYAVIENGDATVYDGED